MDFQLSRSLDTDEGSAALALPVPGPMTPVASPPSSDVEDTLDVDIGRRSTSGEDVVCFPDDQQLRRHLKAAFGLETIADGSDEVEWQGPIVPAPKRLKVHDYGGSPAFATIDSGTSTAASTPVVMVIDMPASPHEGDLSSVRTAMPGRDYSSMSVSELRQELLGPTTDQEDGGFAVDWEKSELIAVLEEMDRICLPSVQALQL
eukprot:SRR837773.6907.p1 GENE.SRR837773.6907~~SRR837773.6907.p1  ORF type:complete len:227 (+),score=18.33 SRR837773.6907:72-683(+)